MKCPAKNILIEYIDNEVSMDLRNKIDCHILVCEKCRNHYIQLKEENLLIVNKLTNYQNFTDKNIRIAPKAAFNPVPKPLNLKDELSNLEAQKKYYSFEGVYNIMSRYKKIIALVCIIAVLALCVSISPVRNAIAAALRVFRIESIKDVRMTYDDLNEISRQAAAGEEINIDKIGKIKLQGGNYTPNVSLDNIKKEIDFDLLTTEIPENFKGLSTPGILEFTPNVKSLNNIIKSYGGNKLLPENVNGKTIIIKSTYSVYSSYLVKDNMTSNSYFLNQMGVPEVIVPDGVDKDKVIDALIDLAIIYQNFTTQLLTMKNSEGESEIPIWESKIEECNINNNKGYFVTVNNPADNSEHYLIFGRIDNTIYCLETHKGKITNEAEDIEWSKNQLIKLAESLK